MHRRGGKRIRMDDPIPPEYENPETPATPSVDYHSNSAEDHELGVSEPSSQSEMESPPSPMKRMTRARARGVQYVPPVSTRMIPPDSVPTTPPTRKRKPGRKPLHEHHSVDDKSLYFVLRNSKAPMASIVDDWIGTYRQNRDTALISLIQFFINASGCKGRITPQMQSEMEHAAIIRKMTEEFDEESGEYPLIMTGQAWKKFRQNFCDFVQTLVKQCQYSIIYDQFLMDNVISMLTGLSDSQVRAFRHTATLAAMKLMTALVDVALLVSVNCDNSLRQYEAERLKARDKRATDRLESLMQKRTELLENMDEIKNMLTYMFKCVFVHRYRDTLPEIRSICMAEIGVWMQKFHSNFLDDSYLKYIGWTLHDKVGEVRLKCLQALLPLYATEELKGKLELFTSKFKDRIVAMTLDKEYEVAVHAVKLVISIFKTQNDILTDKDSEHVYELVYSSHRAVAQAAGEFLNEHLFRLDEESATELRSKRGKKRLPNTPLIRDLVQFFIESELHEHAAYLVDSLIESHPMMKDWECMTDLLLEDAGPSEEVLDNKQESSLIEIMVCCVRQAATGEPPVGRSSSRKMALSAKENKQVLDDKQKLTEHFIRTIPMLLLRFGADSEKLTNLLSIPQYFDLGIYTTSRLENNLQALLSKLQEIIINHTESEVLETCSKTLEYLCKEGTHISIRCDVVKSIIIDHCVDKYNYAMDDWRNIINGDETPDDDETFNVVNSLKKISILYSCHNINHKNLWQSIIIDIIECQNGITDKSLPSEALKYCIEACYFSLIWDLATIETNTDPVDCASSIQTLRSRLDQYIHVCKQIMTNVNDNDLREAAYSSICDLAIMFSEQLAVHPKEMMHPLVYIPCAETQTILNDFVQNYVFIQHHEEGHDEGRIEELHKRRNFLAAFCKLIVYNIIPTQAAADVFKHYVKCYNDYGDIIKSTLGKAREINKVNCAMTMSLSLTGLFKDLQMNVPAGVKVPRNTEEFAELKELAKRFALSFGLDAVKNREAVTALHRSGILFSVTAVDECDDPTRAPSRLPFLEILNEFTNKLLKQDKRVVLSFLERRINDGMPSSRTDEWQPLFIYRNSLLHGETDAAPVTSKRAYTRRKKDISHADEDEEADGENMDSDNEYP
ncbi:cohesin subunit SA-1-like [Ctenocephalides felis]|uniref:cohesin subunit SA-1-like n=1 Tax=Ctenocephalides felis TaxID=7515 RepID=UPI000E6E19DE|nr:cohesin subunit SA-1-like [Ctenocephalides felis]XP_026470237.1 cohesin subunit SA-1-like [Ctenocephalides felis]